MQAPRQDPAVSLHLEHLNPEQLAAVTLPGQHALILAGAGSGKTRVLTTRIAWLIRNGMATPGSVLAVTFTNKAAREMLVRLTAMLPINPRGMWIGTFHGLCNRMLRAHHRDAGLPQTFQILDSADQLAAVKRVVKSLNVDEDKFPPREVQWYINARKEEGLRAGDVQAPDEITRRYLEIYASYDEQCRRDGVVDFPELLLRSFELLNRNEILRAHYAQRFRHLLVDEFQDTNRLQYRWLKLLCGPGACMFAVGDDDQSIYRFRGANVGNMADFERDFQVGKVIRLEQNYRSHGNILDAANALIANNENRLGKNLWTAAGEGEPLRVNESESDLAEARWLVDEVQTLSHEGMRFQDMAVLYRSNAQSRVIEHALFSAGISYRVYGGLRFFERAEVKHALAYLRVVASPEDDNAFLRVCNFPPRGIGARSVEALQDAARAAGVPLFDAIGGLSGKAGNSLGAFRALVEKLRDETRGLPLAEMVEHVIARSGLVEHYKSEREGADRIDNLNELVNAAAAFDPAEAVIDMATGETTDPTLMDPLTAFLAHAALEAGEHQAGEGQDALQMMTVHTAKGLEFHAVFITGLEEGLFPHEQSLNERDGLEEERRLAYVAITRARQRLYLSFAQTRMLHGQTRYNLPSRFLDEIPEKLTKWLTPRYPGQKADRVNAAFGAWGGGGRGSAAPARGGYGTPARAPSGFSGSHGGGSGAGGFRVGQSVQHAKFGAGVIVDAEGSGNDARVQVNFGRQGVKWLAVAVAKLTAA
jgi:DNA helicase-2/ATP-dependent DNA helicase PcrA